MSSKSSALTKIITPLLLIISLTFLPLPFLPPSTKIQSYPETESIKSFIQCFHNLTNVSDLISISNTSSYHSTLLSSLKNNRFLFSATTSMPSLILAAKSDPHVQAAVICAARSNLNIRPRSGGHDYEGLSYCAHQTNSSFITLDISALHSISFEELSGTAWVQAGATLGQLYYEIAGRNKTAAFPAGFCPTVGVGGHVSGGGMGSLTRKYGTAADNVVDARLVDVKGRILNRESMGEELFWAIRGAGAAGFGIIVAFKISLVEVPEKVTVFNAVRTSANQNVTELAGRWQEIGHRLDVDLFIRLIAEATAKKDETTASIKLTFSSLYLGGRKEVLRLAKQSFPELELKASECVEMTWLESFLFFNGLYGKFPVEALVNKIIESTGSFKAKSDFVQKSIPGSGLNKIWRFLMEAYEDGEWFVLIMEPFGGKMSEISEDEIAFPHRKGNLYNIQYILKWLDSEEEKGGGIERRLRRMKSLYELMAPYASTEPRAAYYNYKDMDLGRNAEGKSSRYSAAAEGWGRMYFKGNFRRLAELKGKVDPHNFFWNEQTVPPLHADFM
ncbi:berberine bridge enzyme-like 22 [Phalaenopsis equestris]|uniref:berberine bridge enzyme-like 22 n=1 Tax=Phalaenopsis equestris TaxID=78828 RepID=UPI0009E23A5A|nr:berberine bridge enzyme-like 22 [Phalaenopsis equestris]